MSNFIVSLPLKNIFSESELGEPVTTGQFRQWAAAGGDRAFRKYLQDSGMTVHMTPNPDRLSELATPKQRTAGIPTVIPTKCRDTARRPSCGTEARQASRRYGGIRGWSVAGLES